METAPNITKFLIQSDPDLFPEAEIFKHTIHDTIRTRIGSFMYENLGFEKVKHRLNTNPDRYKDYYPFGTIPFIEYWLKHYHNKKMRPIEVPSILRTEEFLKRDYKVLKKSELPKLGNYFVKNVDKLKAGSFTGNIMSWHISYGEEYNDDSLFVLSSIIDIQSEWRVYVIGGEIKNISNYDGNPTIFPDINIINKMISIFIATGQAPKSFSLDIAVTDKGTAILEIHPFTSIGLYNTLWDESLIQAYKDGIDWYINTNYTL